MKVEDIVFRPPVTVPPDTTVEAAANAMARAGVGAIIVVEQEHPVGIVTDRDLVVRVLAKHLPSDARIDSVMSMNVIAMEASSDVRDAVRAFGHHAVRRLPVVKAGRVVGMLTFDDLVVHLAQEFGEVTKGVTAQLMFPHAFDEPAAPATVT
jgi:signal-transduction protein with cAMP-binding, CBS, and nucleotidyltransferase domain